LARAKSSSLGTRTYRRPIPRNTQSKWGRTKREKGPKLSQSRRNISSNGLRTSVCAKIAAQFRITSSMELDPCERFAKSMRS
jgi:hypothetical protein